MRRFERIAAVSALAVLGAINVRVRAQSAAVFAQTAAYAAAQQNADGVSPPARDSPRRSGPPTPGFGCSMG